jgi:hypothetical protein
VLPRVEQALSGVGTTFTLWECFVAQGAEHGRAADAQVAGDRFSCPPLISQVPDLSMRGDTPLPAFCRQHPGICLRHAGRHGARATFGGHGLTAPLLGRVQVLGMGGEHQGKRMRCGLCQPAGEYDSSLPNERCPFRNDEVH